MSLNAGRGGATLPKAAGGAARGLVPAALLREPPAGSALAAISAMRGGVAPGCASAAAALERRDGSPRLSPIATAAGGGPLDTWGVLRVCEWLGSLGLERHAPAFTAHEVTGATLLCGLSEGDLDTLGVVALGHRKALLAAAGALCEQHRSGGGAGSGGRVHWSHAAPSVAGVAGGVGAPSTGGETLLDGEIDEAAERAAFQAAVLAWRKGGNGGGAGATAAATAASTAAESGSAPSASSTSPEGLWVNPFAGGAAAGGASCGAGAAALASSGGRLADGHLDEAREQAAFQAAVLAWRSGGAAAATPSAGAAVGGAAGSGRKVCCYQCLRVFFETNDDAAGGSSRRFCSTACRAIAADAAAARTAALRSARSESGALMPAATPAPVPQVAVVEDLFAAAAAAGSCLVWGAAAPATVSDNDGDEGEARVGLEDVGAILAAAESAAAELASAASIETPQ